MRWIIIVLFACFVLGASYDILFVGNSYTFYNNLPDMVESMGHAMGDEIYQQQSTPGGYTLWQHSTNETTTGLLEDSRWDFVVLQDQSQMPVIPFYRDLWTFPGGKALADMAWDICAEPVFFMTWGSDIGGAQCIGDYCSADFADYYGYQDSLTASYTRLADTLGTSCAPVGLVWRRCYELRPDLPYWSGDGRHPGIYGSYIACCAIYSTVTGNTTYGCTYHSSLSEEDAGFIQHISDSIVFLEGAEWRRNSTEVIADFIWMNEGPLFFFEDSSSNADTWIWHFGDGSSSTARNAVHEYSIDGTYTVMLIASGICGTDTAYDEITVEGALVSEELVTVGEKLSWQMEGNRLALSLSGRPVMGELLDTNGRRIARGVSMNVDRLPSGIYILRVACNGRRITKKIYLGAD